VLGSFFLRFGSASLLFFSFFFSFFTSKGGKKPLRRPNLVFVVQRRSPRKRWLDSTQPREGSKFHEFGGRTRHKETSKDRGGWRLSIFLSCVRVCGSKTGKVKKEEEKKRKEKERRTKKKRKERKEKLSSSSPSFSSECLFFLPTFLLPSLSSRSTDVSQFVRVKEEGKQKGKPRCIFQPVAIRLCGARCEGSDCVDVSGERRSKEQWKGRKDQKGRKRKCAAVNSGGTILCDATGLNRPSLSCTG